MLRLIPAPIWTFINFTGKNSKMSLLTCHYPAVIYLPKVNDKNTRKSCKICSKSTKKIPDWHRWRRSGVVIVNFEYISHLVLVFLLLPLTRNCRLGKISDSIKFLFSDSEIRRKLEFKIVERILTKLREIFDKNKLIG